MQAQYQAREDDFGFAPLVKVCEGIVDIKRRLDFEDASDSSNSHSLETKKLAPNDEDSDLENLQAHSPAGEGTG